MVIARSHWIKVGTLLIYLACAFAVYGSSLANPFVMDDEVQVIGNSHIQTLSEWPSFFASSSMDSGGSAKLGGLYYKPLMTTYYAIVWHLFGAEPAAFRLPLLLIFTLSAFFVFLLSLSFLSLEYAFCLGLIFLLHPVNTEVALYVADAQDVFYFFFGILSLYLIEKIRPLAWLFTALLLLFSMALLSKETGALFMAIGVSYAFLRRREKWIAVFAASVAVSIAYLAVRWSIGLTAVTNTSFLFHSASLLDRLRMLPLILGHYLETFFFPWRISMSTDFVMPGFPIDLFWIPLGILLLALAVVGAVVYALLRTRQRSVVLFVLSVLLFWFILHGQVFIPLDGVFADRWFYIGVWALCTLLVIFVSECVPSRIGVALLLALASIFAVRSYVRSLDWQDPLRLYSREADLHPWDPVMSNNVGVELVRRERPVEAQPYFVKATELNPQWGTAWNNLGAVRERQGDSLGALKLYERSLQTEVTALACENYVRILLRNNRKDEARQFLDKTALPLYPRNEVLQQMRQMVVE